MRPSPLPNNPHIVKELLRKQHWPGGTHEVECVPPVNIIGASVRRERSLTSECQALGKIPLTGAPARGSRLFLKWLFNEVDYSSANKSHNQKCDRPFHFCFLPPLFLVMLRP